MDVLSELIPQRIFMIIHKDGTILSAVGEETPTFFGYAKEDIIGNNISKLIAPVGIDTFNKELQSIELNVYKKLDSYIRSKSGSIKSALIIIFTMNINNEDFLCVNVIEGKEDKHIQQFINEINKKILDNLILGVMHEINNPNNFFMLNIPFIEMLFDEFKPILDKYYEEHPDWQISGLDYSFIRDDFKLLMSDLYEGSNRIKKITSSLADLFIVDVAYEEVNIAGLINTCLDEFSLQALSKNIEIKTRYQSEDIFIFCDRKSLQKSIKNVILNAFQAVRDISGTRSIKIFMDCDEQRGMVKIKVSDTGNGISVSNIHDVFSPFFTTKRGEACVGLGLYVSQYIIKKHDGDISIKSELNKGTDVFIKLPYLKK